MGGRQITGVLQRQPALVELLGQRSSSSASAEPVNVLRRLEIPVIESFNVITNYYISSVKIRI